MRHITFIIFILLSIQASAQKFYFLADNYKDSATQAAFVSALAKQLTAHIAEKSKEDSLYSLFMCQIAAGQYEASNKTIDALRSEYARTDTTGLRGFALQYEIYNLVKLQHPQNKASFQHLYDSLYGTKYQRLNKFEKTEAGNEAVRKASDLLQKLNDVISKTKGSDSLDYLQANRLIQSYVPYMVMQSAAPALKTFYAAVEEKEYHIKKVLIPLRDGGQIEAMVTLKDTTQKLPVVLVFNIYIDEARAKRDTRFAADNGYAAVEAFTRGKGESPQNIEPYEHDANDAYDIIDWISKQSFCNGKVGMWGGSYVGFTQWAAAKTMHPALKSIMPQVPVAPGIDYPNGHGIFMTEPLRWIHYTTNNKQTDNAERNDTTHWWHVLRKWYVSGASSKSLDSAEGRPNAIYQRWMQHPYPDDFWKKMTCYDTDFDKVTIPVLTTTGYFDDEQTGAMYYFNEHYKHNKNANHYLVIGPYDHGGAQAFPKRTLNGYAIDSVAWLSFLDLAVKWFDYTLKDSAKPAFLQDKVNYEVMNGNEWKHASSLSGISNDTLTFYLTKEGKNNEFMFGKEPNGKQYIQQTVNLADRSDTTEQNRTFGEPERIIDSVLQTKNSLVFVSSPFDTSFIINNSFFGKLYASINKKDMDVSIYMWEQMPDGKYFSLGSWLQRASLAKDRSERQLLESDKKEMIPVSWSYLTGKRISKGSRLIITLGINSSYNTEVNYGTGKPVNDETIADAKEPLQIKWFGDSFIKVPVWR